MVWGPLTELQEVWGWGGSSGETLAGSSPRFSGEDRSECVNFMHQCDSVCVCVSLCPQMLWEQF